MTAQAATLTITAMSAGDWGDVARIYAEGIASGDATFESEVPDWERFDRSHLPGHRLVAATEAGPVGWAALAPVSERCVYGGVAEVSVYVAADARGQGVGTALLAALVTSAESGGLWTLQAGIFPENAASARLHERAGFRLVGRRERLGRLRGEWRDVLQMERRSRVVN